MLLPYESKLGCRWHLEAKSQFADVVWEKTLQQNWSCRNYCLTTHTSEEDAQCPICAWKSTQCCWGSRSQYHSELPFIFAMLADASVCVERDWEPERWRCTCSENTLLVSLKISSSTPKERRESEVQIRMKPHTPVSGTAFSTIAKCP